ncbi:hypothetical protein BHU09_06475 [Tannerella sp. oral taxon 808]|nr:hypothetical protein BHU09_06475 [Tannerella sp. oral taxon 808]
MKFSDRKHILRLLEQQSEVKRIFDQFARDAGRELARFAPKADPGRVLPADVWIQNRVAEQRIEKLLLQLHDDLLANFDAHTRAAWEAANKKADAMIADFIRGLPISETARRGMFARNAHAFRSFMQRKEAGMNLSERIWKATESAKENLAYFVASGVAEGRPAALISQDIRALLLEPDRRFHRIRNARGQLVLSRPMREYHPGAGVYRSSYMNALRVGATETNIAYHEADHERWQRLDFVLGVKVERSGTSSKPCPVCDAMQGTYPKGFKFLPWHPFCICHATPVMLSGEEFTDYLVTGHMPPGRVLRDMPQRALEYVEQHPYYRNSYSFRHNVPFFDPQAAAANTSGSGAPAKPPRPEKTAALNIRRKELFRIARLELKGKTVIRPELKQPIEFTGTGIKEVLNQPHDHVREKNEAILDIVRLIQEAEYIGGKLDDKGRNLMFHYFKTEIAGDPSFIVIKEDLNIKKASLYTITDKSRSEKTGE